MFDTASDEGGPSVETAAPRSWKRVWNDAFYALVLVRLGQELGSDSKIAQTIATVIDAVVGTLGKVL